MPGLEEKVVVFCAKGAGCFPRKEKKRRGYVHKNEKEEDEADFPFSECRRWGGGMFVFYTKKGWGRLPHKEKRGYVHKTEKEKMKADFPMGKRRQ